MTDIDTVYLDTEEDYKRFIFETIIYWLESGKIKYSEFLELRNKNGV